MKNKRSAVNKNLSEPGEIVREIECDDFGIFYINENHSVSDILNWCIKEGIWEEMQALAYFVNK